MTEYDDYVSGRVDARYYNYMANKPGDEAEQNPIPEDLCPVCGKGNSELFMAGHEDDGTEVWGSRGISHIDCAWQLHTEMYRPQPYYYDQWKAEKQRAEKWEWVARHELNIYHAEYAGEEIEAEVNICEEREDWEVDELLSKYEETL